MVGSLAPPACPVSFCEVGERQTGYKWLIAQRTCQDAGSDSASANADGHRRMLPLFGDMGSADLNASTAVSALRSVPITIVYYDFDPEGPHPDLVWALNPAAAPSPPGWAADLVGIDFVHRAVQVHLATEHVNSALPHLKRLPCLRRVYVFRQQRRGYERLQVE